MKTKQPEYSNKIYVNGKWIDFIPFKEQRTPSGGYYQGQSSPSYWRRRAKEQLNETFEDAEEIISYEQAIYERCLRNLVKEYKALIRPYVVDGEIDLALLNKARVSDIHFFSKEQKLFQMIDGFTKSIPNRQINETQNLLENVYTKTSKNIQNRLGFRAKSYLFDKDVVSAAVRTPWTKDGREFSDRIWQHTNELNSSLRQTISEAVAKGEAPNKTIKKLKDEFGNSAYNTARIVRTESAAIQTRSTIDTYKELGVEYYEVIGSSADGLCSPCIGKKVRVDEAEIGVNTPPFHPFCRCGIIPIID